MPQTTLLDGRTLAKSIRSRLAILSDSFKETTGMSACLAAYLVGSNPASRIYVANKQRAAKDVGVDTCIHILPASTSTRHLADHMRNTAKDKRVNGILLQLPLPPGFPTEALLADIPAIKDVDGLHTLNAGKMSKGDSSGLLPCTPQGCMALIHMALGCNLSGLHAVVLGRSQIVGLPMARLLLNADCSVSQVHSRTPLDLRRELTRRADIVVSAIGKPGVITGDDIMTGSCLVDVGINRVDTNGKTRLCGDIDQNSVCPAARYLTPVPGGVGPMTIAFLLFNTLKTAYRQHNLDTSEFDLIRSCT